MERESERTLKRIQQHSFAAGYYTGVIVICVMALIYTLAEGLIIGNYGPVKRAYEGKRDGEKGPERGEMLSDEQPEGRDGEWRGPLHRSVRRDYR